MNNYTLDQAVEFYINGFWVPALIKAVHPLPSSSFAYTVQPDLANYTIVGPSGPFSNISPDLIRLSRTDEATTESALASDISNVTVSAPETADTAAVAGSPSEDPATINTDPSLDGSSNDPLAGVS